MIKLHNFFVQYGQADMFLKGLPHILSESILQIVDPSFRFGENYVHTH